MGPADAVALQPSGRSAPSKNLRGRLRGTPSAHVKKSRFGVVVGAQGNPGFQPMTSGIVGPGCDWVHSKSRRGLFMTQRGGPFASHFHILTMQVARGFNMLGHADPTESDAGSLCWATGSPRAFDAHDIKYTPVGSSYLKLLLHTLPHLSIAAHCGFGHGMPGQNRHYDIVGRRWEPARRTGSEFWVQSSAFGICGPTAYCLRLNNVRQQVISIRPCFVRLLAGY